MLIALADENIDVAIVAALLTRGMDVVTVREVGLKQPPDTLILERAFILKRIVLTNDQDFLSLAAEHWKSGRTFAPIFF